MITDNNQDFKYLKKQKTTQKYYELPTEGFEKCILCGAKSNGYAFCRKCFKEHTEDELLKILNSSNNPQSKKVEDRDPYVNQSSNHDKQSICPICGNNSFGKEVCATCYIEICNKQEEIDKNQKPWELKDYFYNLNSSIYRVKENNFAKGQIFKLYAIAWIVRDLYKDTQLSDIVGIYTKKILENRKNTQEQNITEVKKRTDRDIVAVTNPNHRATDGHICKSEAEVLIDDLLYEFKICHAYGLKVKEIPSTERAVYADWFVQLDSTAGIYIEYWGMDKQDYYDNKKEKLELYNKYRDRINLLEIEKNEINDKQNLRNNLYQRLMELGWKDPNWKK